MHVTIVIPTHDRARLLASAIRASLVQSHRELRVLVIDDASTDDTAARLAAFADDPRVAWVRLERSLGVAGAMNLGLMLAEGEAITFHDTADIPARDKVAAQVAALTAGARVAEPAPAVSAGRRPGHPPRYDVALCGHVLIGMDGAERHSPSALDTDLAADRFRMPQERVRTTAGLFRCGLFARLGGFTAAEDVDRDLHGRVLAAGAAVAFAPRPLLTRFECSDTAPTAGQDDRRVQGRMALASGRAAGLPARVDVSGFAVAAVHAHRPLALNPAIPARGFHSSLAIFRRIRMEHGAVAALAAE